MYSNDLFESDEEVEDHVGWDPIRGFGGHNAKRDVNEPGTQKLLNR